jgi:tetratricopeptide (TPR) repeat protein
VKRIIGIVFLILFAFLTSAVGMAAEKQQWEELFFAANQAYKEGHFQEAADAYGQLIKSGHRNGHLFYNLGNSYVRLDELGQAILNFERGRLLMPRDADLNFNLDYARDQTQDVVSESDGFISTTFFWLDSLSLHELLWSFVVLNVLFWAILVARLFSTSDGIYYVFLAIFVSWLTAGVSFGLKWYQVEADDRAVILNSEVRILAGPDMQDTALFKLHAGTVIHHERSEDGWSLIRLSDQKRGWVQSEAIERIASRAKPLALPHGPLQLG